MLANAVKETTTTSGTGTVTLSAVAGFARFSVLPLGATVDYVIKTASGNYEWGIGVVGASNTLERTYVTATLVSGVYTSVGATALNLSGTNEVQCTMHAQSSGPVIPNLNSNSTRYIVPDGLQPANSTRGLATDVPVGCCLRWSCAAAISHLVCDVTTAQGTGSDRIQLGIYSCTPDGSVGGLIARTGDLAPNTTGIKSGAIVGGNIQLPPGWYWWVIASSVNPTIRAYNAGSPGAAVIATPMGNTTTLNTRIGSVTMNPLSGGWTALPDTLSVSAMSSVLTTFPPVVGGLLV